MEGEPVPAMREPPSFDTDDEVLEHAARSEEVKPHFLQDPPLCRGRLPRGPSRRGAPFEDIADAPTLKCRKVRPFDRGVVDALAVCAPPPLQRGPRGITYKPRTGGSKQVPFRRSTDRCLDAAPKPGDRLVRCFSRGDFVSA